METTREVVKGRIAAELQEVGGQPIISGNKSRYRGPRNVEEYEVRRNLATIRAYAKCKCRD